MNRDDEDFIISVWGQAGKNVLDIARNMNLGMKISDFQDCCDIPRFFSPELTSAGEWFSIFMSGLKKVAPDIWDAIPSNPGAHGLDAICCVMTMIGITEE